MDEALIYPSKYTSLTYSTLHVRHRYLNYRIFGQYTMEVILVTAFGHKVDLVNGQSDELTKASESVFEAMRKGNAEPIVTLLC